MRSSAALHRIQVLESISMPNGKRNVQLEVLQILSRNCTIAALSINGVLTLKLVPLPLSHSLSLSLSPSINRAFLLSGVKRCKITVASLLGEEQRKNATDSFCSFDTMCTFLWFACGGQSHLHTYPHLAILWLVFTHLMCPFTGPWSFSDRYSALLFLACIFSLKEKRAVRWVHPTGYHSVTPLGESFSLSFSRPAETPLTCTCCWEWERANEDANIITRTI